MPDLDATRPSESLFTEATRHGPGVDRVFGTCSDHGPYELPLGSVDSGEIKRRCPGCETFDDLKRRSCDCGYTSAFNCGILDCPNAPPCPKE